MDWRNETDLKRSLVKNAISNLSRGGAAAAVALVLPPILVRHMTTASYSVWVLALQAAAYLGYLDFGLQTAVGRYIAFANEKQDPKSRDAIFSTAFAGLSIAAALGLVVVAGIALAAHSIFPAMPVELLPALRMTLLIVGVSTALGLPASAWNGVFVGLQRFDIPAITVGSGKLLGAIGLIVAALTGRSLVTMAMIAAAANFYSYAFQFAMKRRLAPEVRFHPGLITRPVVKELLGYCMSLTVWSLSMLLVSGFDLLLVGRFEFAAVTPYAVAATLITFLAGLQVAIFGVIMPHSAQLHARSDSTELGRLLLNSTRIGVLLLSVTGLPLIVFASPIVGTWIGHQFAASGGAVLALLVIANMVRLTGVPYASILIGTGQQKLILISPLMEGISNLVASILLGMRFGAIGVAWGTLIGAVIGMLANLVYNIPRTKGCIDISRSRYISFALAAPSACLLPVCLVWCVLAYFRQSVPGVSGFLLPVAAVSFGLCAFFLIRVAMQDRGSAGGLRDVK